MIKQLILSSQGIYVPPSNAFPRRFHNMGIRIEVSSLTIVILHADLV
jgi:hypothetical protein